MPLSLSNKSSLIAQSEIRAMMRVCKGYPFIQKYLKLEMDFVL